MVSVFVEKQIRVKPENSVGIPPAVDQFRTLVVFGGNFELGGEVSSFPEIRILCQLWVH